MSDKVMKIAGKTDQSLVKGIKVTDAGNIENVKKWHYEYTTILNNQEIRSTSAIVVNGGDIEDYGIISFRISNSLDSSIKIGFYSDGSKNGGSSTLKDLEGNDLVVIIPANKSVILLTPNEIPFLNYLRYIKLRVTATTAPTTGTLTIILCKKG